VQVFPLLFGLLLAAEFAVRSPNDFAGCSTIRSFVFGTKDLPSMPWRDVAWHTSDTLVLLGLALAIELKAKVWSIHYVEHSLLGTNATTSLYRVPPWQGGPGMLQPAGPSSPVTHT